MECATHENERSRQGLTLLPDTEPETFTQNRSVSSDAHIHTHKLTHTLMAKADPSNYTTEGPTGLKWLQVEGLRPLLTED